MIATGGSADWLSDFPRVRLLDYAVRIESVVPELDIWRRDHGLTPRQAEVAILMSERLGSKEIARELKISPHTVRRHEEIVLRRLGVRRRTEVSEVLSSGSSRE